MLVVLIAEKYKGPPGTAASEYTSGTKRKGRKGTIAYNLFELFWFEIIIISFDIVQFERHSKAKVGAILKCLSAMHQKLQKLHC